MRALLLVLIGGAICYNYTESVTVADAFIKTLVQVPKGQYHTLVCLEDGSVIFEEVIRM